MAKTPSRSDCIIRRNSDALTLHYYLEDETNDTLFDEFVQLLLLQLTNNKTITTFRLHAYWNHKFRIDTSKSWALLFQMLQSNNIVTTIKINGWILTTELAQLFAKTVLFNINFYKVTPNPISFTSLTHLDLSKNIRIGIIGVYAIVDALCANPNGCTLEVLNLTNVMKKWNSDPNGIMKQSLAERLVALLQQTNSKLKELDLSENDLVDEFVSIFATGLKNNTQLRKLRLTRNDITNIGATAIANALVYNKTLLKLDLSRNDIANDGAIAITQALRYHPSLVYFAICQNGLLTRDGILEASQFLLYNESINYFHWRHYVMLNAEFMIALQSILCYNDTIRKHRYLYIKKHRRTKRIAPKKGLRRRQDMFKFLQREWLFCR